MSWTMNASGHTDEDGEAWLIEALADILTDERAGTSMASISTTHHGYVDLGTDALVADDQ